MSEELNFTEEMDETGAPETEVTTISAPEPDTPDTAAPDDGDELDFDAFRQDALRKKAILERVNKIQRIVTMVITVIVVILIVVIGVRKASSAGGESAVMPAPAGIVWTFNTW